MLYCSLDMAGNRCHCDFSFWAKKNQNLKKMKKMLGHIIILYVYQKLQSDDVRFLRYSVRLEK